MDELYSMCHFSVKLFKKRYFNPIAPHFFSTKGNMKGAKLRFSKGGGVSACCARLLPWPHQNHNYIRQPPSLRKTRRGSLWSTPAPFLPLFFPPSAYLCFLSPKFQRPFFRLSNLFPEPHSPAGPLLLLPLLSKLLVKIKKQNNNNKKHLQTS